jgi:NADPH2:quinone reductase
MTSAIRLDQIGGPEVLSFREVDCGEPQPGQIAIRHTAIGVNYIDIYHRTGVYPLPLPATLGVEGAGVVVAVGAKVEGIQIGDRVAYAGGPPGAYSLERVLDAARAVLLPGTISDEKAVSGLFAGLTAQFLLRQVHPVKAGETVVVHAAAGKVGLIMCQWAHHLGATVIGTVSSDEKARIAVENGCDVPVVYTREAVPQAVSRATGGAKAHVVYDSVGKNTFIDSLECLRPKGLLVSFGVASGETPLLDLRLLLAKGSLFVTRPSFGHYMNETATYRKAVQELFSLVTAGVISFPIGQRFALKDAATAHRSLEERRTTAATILVP